MNKKCQVFTPKNYVNELLNSIQYRRRLCGKKILENSCGDGNILSTIVERYIRSAKKENLSLEEIKKGLQEDIYGVEIDSEQFKKCIERIDAIARKNGIENVKWSVYNDDFLRWCPEMAFDYIIGNPPYITYRDIPGKDRKYIKKSFETCKFGKFDYSYAFIEKSIQLLAYNGKMAYLIPSSFFKTVFGEALRNYIKPYIVRIEDYGDKNIFDDALVKSAIIVLKRSIKDSGYIVYKEKKNNTSIMINKRELIGKWILACRNQTKGRRFGDEYRVSHSIATLLNDAFILREGDYEERRGYYCVNGYRIEKELIRNAVSPRSIYYNKDEKIIFPYRITGEGVARFTVSEFEKKYPCACVYLRRYSKQLEHRRIDSGALWFEYGRSQGLRSVGKEKLLLSTVVTNRVNVYRIEPNTVPYSGLMIEPRGSSNMQKAIDVLSGKEFLEYVQKIGIRINGSSIRITSRDIENYCF